VPSFGGSDWYWGERSTSPGPNNLTWGLWQKAGQDLQGTVSVSSTQH
jgi:hypothetical protein